MADIQKLCFGCMREKPDFSAECPYCKHDGATDNNPNALPMKTLLQDRYLVGAILNENGEGITYIGFDTKKEAIVRIREFFPEGIAERINTFVRANSQSAFTFDSGKNEFYTLARTLSKMNGFDGLLNILDIFEQNGTAYYVTEYIEAITLRDFLIRNGGTLNFDQLKTLFTPIVMTLSSLHSIDVVHRGVSSDTVLVGKDGKLRLTEFSIAAARTARTDYKSHLHKGYAAIEQYGYDGKQGPWTDVYSLGALMYRVLTGRPPLEATSRINDDKITISSDLAKEMPSAMLSALANALNVMPEERSQNLDAIKNALISSKSVSKTTLIKGESEQKGTHKNRKIITLCIIICCLIIALITVFALKSLDEADTVNVAQTTVATENTTKEIGANSSSETVPDFVNLGITYSDLVSSSDPQLIKYNARFTFEVTKKYTKNNEPVGAILSQSPKAGTPIKDNQVIKLVVSMGSEYINVPNVSNYSREKAFEILVKEGFSPENIEFVYEKSMSNYKPDSVISAEPAFGESVKRDRKIKVHMNTYVETTTTTTTITTTTKAPDTTTTTQTQTAPQ